MKYGATVLECDVLSTKGFGFVHVETNSDTHIADKLISKYNSLSENLLLNLSNFFFINGLINLLQATICSISKVI